MGDVKVSLEAFGNKRLTTTIPEHELKGMNIEQVVEKILGQEWGPEEMRTLTAIETERTASGGYNASIGIEETNKPIVFQPVKLGERMTPYIEKYAGGGIEESQALRLSITGAHVVGYNR